MRVQVMHRIKPVMLLWSPAPVHQQMVANIVFLASFVWAFRKGQGASSESYVSS